MLKKLEELSIKFQTLQDQMSLPEVFSDMNRVREISKEIKDLEPVVKKFAEYKAVVVEIEDARELLPIEDDADMIEMLKETITDGEESLVNFEEELKVMLLPKDPNDGKNAIMEIRGAAGGDEANIFAGDLFRMYSKYFDTLGLKVEVLETNTTESGGFSLISALIKGENVFSRLKYESGSHRVQRVPLTESAGRIHTSTATVIVMPEVEAVDVDINANDLNIDVYRSGGAGGQSVNTTDSAVRITHLPTGIVVTSQDERSQLRNKERAMKHLAARLYDHFLTEQNEANDSERKGKLGTGSRAEKIRTYNYPQNRVTDHRIGLTLNKLDQVMEGKMGEIIDALMVEDQLQRMQEGTK